MKRRDKVTGTIPRQGEDEKLDKTKWVLLFAAVACSLLLLSAQASAKMFSFKTSNEYSVDKDFKLTISNTSGDIKVEHYVGDKVILEVNKEVDAGSRDEAEKVADELDVTVNVDHKSIDIDTRYPRGRHGDFWEKLFDWNSSNNCSVNYYLQVPTSLDLQISTTSGDITLTGLSGRGSVAATSGDVDIDDFTGNLDAETTSGDIRFKDIKGDIDANSTSSDVLFESVTGNINIKSTSGETEAHFVNGEFSVTKTSGDVTIEDVSGDIDISTTSGNIDIKQREGGVFVSTASGDVKVRSEMQNGRRYEIETISGNIDFAVPSEMKGHVKLETVSGTINTDLAIEVRSFNKKHFEGRIGGDGPDLRLSTTSGDISLLGF